MRVVLWSCEETGIDPPAKSLNLHGHRCWKTRDALLFLSANGRYAGYLSAVENVCLDRRRQFMVGYCTNVVRQSPLLQGRPLFFPLTTWFHDNGLQIIHAALVGINGSAVLIPARSGCGKSTTAVACSLSGMDFFGDDLVAIKKNPTGKWEGFTLYHSAWLHRHQLDLLQETFKRSRLQHVEAGDKVLVWNSCLQSGRSASKTIIRAIAVPEIIESEHSSYGPGSKMAAYQALSLGTLESVVPRPSPEDLNGLSELVDNIACFQLKLGRNLKHIPHVIGQLLEEIPPL